MLRRLFRVVTLAIVGGIAALLPDPQPTPPPVIHLWYSTEQRFGDRGLPQRFVNILGNLEWFGRKRPKLDYSLNDGPWTRLSIGPDDNRLVALGDFNADIETAELYDGPNRLVFKARDKRAGQARQEMVVHFRSDRAWPLPYDVDFSVLDRIEDAVQIVDGRWALVDGGARTLERGYDRVLALGDMGWRDYEVTVEATIHSFSPPHEGPPSYGVTHFGIAARWKGHHGRNQPRSGWFPIGAATEFTLDTSLAECRWRLLAGNDARPILAAEPHGAPFALGRRYVFKMQVSTDDGPTSVYRVKMWPAGDTEPPRWDLEGRDAGPDYQSGAALLVAHHTDVTIWKVAVAPVPRD